MEHRHRPLTFFITLLIVFLGGGLTAYASREAIYNEMGKLDLIPTPQHFTEIYFNDYNALPHITTAKKPISFSFTIHNLEGTTTTYPYAGYFEQPNGNQDVFADGTVTLKDNATTSITLTFTPKISNETGKVFVDLTSLNEQIDFILPNNNP